MVETTGSASIEIAASPATSPILDGEHFQKMNRHQSLLKNIAKTLDNLKRAAES